MHFVLRVWLLLGFAAGTWAIACDDGSGGVVPDRGGGGEAPSGATYHVATDGNDRNGGTLASPFASFDHAIDVAEAGDTVYVRGGTYLLERSIEIRKSGAEALAKYPWEEREEVGAKDARTKAAGVVLDVLDREPDDGVVVALLAAARSLTEALLARIDSAGI